MDERWETLFDGVYDEKYPDDIAAQQDTLKKRAVAARPILVKIAEEGEPGDEKLVTRKRKENRKTIEYGDLAEEVDSDAAYMSKVLGAIDLVGVELDEPPLSPLVESAGTVGPGRKYFRWAFHGEDQIEHPGDKSSLTPGMKETWRRHLCEAYAYDSWYRTE